MGLRDIGELVVLLLACISVPTIFALSKAGKGEPFGDSKLPIIWTALVGAAYGYYMHSIDPYWVVSPFIGTLLFGIIANGLVYSLIEKRINEKEYAKKEMERKENEIRELRKEIEEIRDKERSKQ